VIPWNSTLFADDPTVTSCTGALFVDIRVILQLMVFLTPIFQSCLQVKNGVKTT